MLYNFSSETVKVNFNHKIKSFESDAINWYSHAILDSNSSKVEASHTCNLLDWEVMSTNRNELNGDQVVWNTNKLIVNSIQNISLSVEWDDELNTSISIIERKTLDEVNERWRFWEFIQRISIYPHLLRSNKFLVHCVAIVNEGKAYIFMGPSGVGKSTIATKAIKSGYKILSDDTVLVEVCNKTGKLFAQTTPYKSKSGIIGIDGRYEVKNFFILEQHKNNFLEEVKRIQFAKSLIERVFETQYISHVFDFRSNGIGVKSSKRILDLVNYTSRNYRCFKLYNNIDFDLVNFFKEVDNNVCKC